MIEVQLKKVVGTDNIMEVLYGTKDNISNLDTLLDFLVAKTTKLMDKLDKVSKDDDISVQPIALKDDDCQKMAKLFKSVMSDALDVINKKCGTYLKLNAEASKRYRDSSFTTLKVGRGYGWELPGLGVPSGVVNETATVVYRVDIAGHADMSVLDRAELRTEFAKTVVHRLVEIYAYACEVQSDMAITDISGMGDVVFVDADGFRYTYDKNRKHEIVKVSKSKIYRCSRYGAFAKLNPDSTFNSRVQLYFVETVEGLVAFNIDSGRENYFE